jgi:DNA-directed RNA polymerase specialized sigma24 family protein
MVKQSELLSSMTEEEWLDLYNRLRLFTYKRYYWLRDLEGIIQEAIIDTIQGKRRWPSVDKDTDEVKISLFVFLCDVIRSKVSHLWEREKRQLSLDSFYENTSVLEPKLGDSAKREVLLNESATEYWSLISRQDPYSQLVHKEVVDKMFNLVSHDETLTKILQLWLQEPDLKPRQIAERMGLNVKQIYLILKKLQKRLVNLQGGLQNE